MKKYRSHKIVEAAKIKALEFDKQGAANIATEKDGVIHTGVGYQEQYGRYTSIGGEICQNCNRTYKTIYRVPDEIWEEVTGQKEGLLCISCFDQLASVKGFKLLWIPRKHEVYK